MIATAWSPAAERGGAGDATDSYVEATPQAMRQAVFAFKHPESWLRPPTAARQAERPQDAQVQAQGRPGDAPVKVVNGNGAAGSAARAGAAL